MIDRAMTHRREKCLSAAAAIITTITIIATIIIATIIPTIVIAILRDSSAPDFPRPP
jgi:hypothetical protein